MSNVLEQALEALTEYRTNERLPKTDEAIAALKESIKQQGEPVDSMRQQLDEANDFIKQLADHCQNIEKELMDWREGRLKRKSKSPYLNGELAGDCYPGIGCVPAPKGDKP